MSKNTLIKKVMAKLKDKLPGGLADNIPDSEFDSKQLEKGIEIEMEHVKDKELAKEIAKDHLAEIPNYYLKQDGFSRLDILEEEAEEEWESMKASISPETSELIIKQIEELKNILKKYNLVKTNIERIEEEIKKIVKPEETVNIHHKSLSGFYTNETKHYLKDQEATEKYKEQKKSMVKEFKYWINNFRAYLNKLKLKDKSLEVKDIINTFIKFDISVNN